MFLFARLLTCLLVVTPGVSVGDDMLPASILRLPESTAAVFIADTSAAQIHRYDRAGDRVVLAGSYRMSIGRAGAGKQRAGDRRTPIGVYFVTEQLDTSRLHEKYGATAFPLDYPNVWDHRRKRTGDGIWVHGVDPNGGERPAFDTDGCLALPNEDLLSLEDAFVAGSTPVIVTQQTAFQSAADIERLANTLTAAVTQWANSQASGDMHTYLSLYATDFSRWSMNAEEWRAFAMQTVAQQPIESVEVSDLLLLRYPGEQQLYISRFRARIAKAGSTIERTQRLYWRLDEQGDPKIVAADSG